MRSRLSRGSGILLIAGLALLAAAQLPPPVPATQPAPPFNPAAHNLPASANALVREVIGAQLIDKPEPAYLFRLRRETPAGAQTKEIIETSEGRVALLLAINDQPLNEEQRQKEDARLEDFLKNPEEQTKQRERQKADGERTRKMLRAIPDAFNYTYDGTEAAPSQARPLVRLTFKPNPDFKPADREAQVFRGMEGLMLIDPRERHLVKIDAHLVQDVNFGWGIFGRLDKGGYFKVQQSKIASDRWDISEMTLDFTGKVLLFKRLRIKEYQTASHFRPVPQNLSLQDGVRMLRENATEVAQKK